jgi:hypothetical protein
VFSCPYLSHGAIVLYGWLQQHCGEKGCFPSYELLAKEMRAGERSVARYRQELEDAGVIIHKRGGGASSNHYSLHPERLRDIPAKMADIGASRPKWPVEVGQNGHSKSAKMARESNPVNQTQLTRDSAPTERTAPPSKPAPTIAAATPKAPAPTVEATPAEREHVPRKRAGGKAPAITGEEAPRGPTPIQRVEQGIKAAGVRVAMNWGVDGKSLAALLSGSDVTVEDVIGCFVDITTHKYGDEFMRKGLTVTLVCTRYVGPWLNWKENGEKGEHHPGVGGLGGAARARPSNPGRPTNPQHAAHAAKLDW